jgi:hypothetical protein
MSQSVRHPLPQFEVANRIGTLISFAIIVAAILAGANLVAVAVLLVLSIVSVVLICSPSRPWWRHDRVAADAILADRERVKRESIRDLAVDFAGFVAIGLIYALRSPLA